MEESRLWGRGAEEGMMEIEMVDLINEDGRGLKGARGEEYNRRLEPHDDLPLICACEKVQEVEV